MQRALRKFAARWGLTADGRRTQIVLGAGVVLVAVVSLAATTMLYMHPLGRKTIAFETTDASSVGIGAEVRVAGITVGKVTKLSIQPKTVRVDAEIDNGTFVGSDTRVDVRMLTPVGGYAVTLVPLGNASLGSAVIPADRVSVPYSIGDVLQAAPNVTDKVNGGPIDANIDQIADALQHNSGSVGSLIAGMNSIATVMDEQREQVRNVMDMAAQYLQTFNTSRDFVFELIRQVEIVLSTYNNTHAGFNEAYELLGDTVYRIIPIENFYLEHEPQVRPLIEQLRAGIADFQQHMGPAIDQLQQLRDRLAAWLTPDGMAEIGSGTILASGICIPIPGRTC
ncbi:MCE family protein [Nocardia sp. ET3-3]|uniref:MCE family protein n=1 Tax=Nocardia terrae TaxID=2675851 RepID=A0A7K1V2N4_9NOCA|nr:MlaD family protein [Nocardia terrae]MVU80777.1 MCE family protein [Nocardia terrae]